MDDERKWNVIFVTHHTDRSARASEIGTNLTLREAQAGMKRMLASAQLHALPDIEHIVEYQFIITTEPFTEADADGSTH